MSSSTVLRRLVPRHAKAYMYICFLVMVFGCMILSDNGFSLYNIFAAPLPSYEHTAPANRTREPMPAASYVQVAYAEDKPSTPPPSHHAEQSSNEQLRFGTGSNAFTPSDVVIMFKTGATSLWRRVPIHLSTTLSSSALTPNIAFYSDNADHIAGRPIIDVLANVSSALKSTPDFELYRNIQDARDSNLYLEAAAMDGDHYLPGGWRLDKYKFLPLAAHAAKQYPQKKWYIYMEDDNYFFWRSLYAWLSTFDPSQPHLLGSPAARLGEDFAHGGSGFAISGTAMQATFGTHPDLADKFESYAKERCCGDQVLSHAMASLGVARDRRYDHTEWAGLQALPTWRIGFGEWNWCSPVFNVHKTHQADVSDLFVFEREFQAERGVERVLRYRDLFEGFVLKGLKESRSEWDNEAGEKWFASKEEDAELSAEDREVQPWFSRESCRNACEKWEQCLSWKYADDSCALASTAAQGRRIEAGIRMDSGWMVGRIEKLAGKKCESLGY